jgi:hypothetical protein
MEHPVLLACYFNVTASHQIKPASRSTAWALTLEHWERGFESHSRHGCMSAILCGVLSCVGRGACN